MEHANWLKVLIPCAIIKIQLNFYNILDGAPPQSNCLSINQTDGFGANRHIGGKGVKAQALPEWF